MNLFFRKKEIFAKFSDLTTEELEYKLICLENKSFGKFVTSSINYDVGFFSQKELEREKSALMLLKKDTLTNTVNRINSIEEQYDGYKVFQLIIALFTTLLVVLGNRFFFHDEMIKQHGLTWAAIMFGAILFSYIFLCTKAISLIKKEHSKLIFFKFVVEECIEKKKQQEEKKNVTHIESA